MSTMYSWTTTVSIAARRSSYPLLRKMRQPWAQAALSLRATSGSAALRCGAVDQAGMLRRMSGWPIASANRRTGAYGPRTHRPKGDGERAARPGGPASEIAPQPLHELERVPSDLLTLAVFIRRDRFRDP